MTELANRLAGWKIEVDRALDELLPAESSEPVRLHSAIRWSVFAGGKRIRPALVRAVGETFGAEPQNLMRTAAAVEMIHTYSLIHDDLPAMDDDDLRRGKPTCHVQFGEATAILAGDALQSLAFKAIADDEDLSADIRVRLISALASASSTPAGMVSGQQLDLEGEGRSSSIVELERIHSQKTGALISASAIMGAVIGGASDEELSAIGRYASNLGLLFQITDDLLDVTQETATLGKTAGKDAAVNKATYPALYGVERSIEIASDMLDSACAALAQIEQDTEMLKDIAHFVAGRTQ